MDKNKILIVYTALFGDYDNLIDPVENYENCLFICFTDNLNITSKIWQIRYINKLKYPPYLMNRMYKWLPHLYFKNYNYSLYIDSNILIKENVYDFIHMFNESDKIFIPKHFSRNCIYEEFNTLILEGKIEYNLAMKQLNFYELNSFPKNFGLTENNIILRYHNDENIIKLMNYCWNDLLKFTKRDQLCLMYNAWFLNITIKELKYSSRGSKYFKTFLHKKNKSFFIIDILNSYVRNYPKSCLTKIIIYIKFFNSTRNYSFFKLK